MNYWKDFFRLLSCTFWYDIVVALLLLKKRYLFYCCVVISRLNTKQAVPNVALRRQVFELKSEVASWRRSSGENLY